MKIYLYFVEFSNNIQKQTEKPLILFGPLLSFPGEIQ